LLASTIGTGCSNIIRSGLMNSNTIFLDPNTSRTIYTQLRNASENQQVTLMSLNSKLTAKGYQLVQDPEQANYWIQAKVIYCHKAAEGVTPENVAKAGPGAGISTGGTPMASAADPMAGNMMQMAGMPDMNAMMRQISSMRGMGGMGFPGMQPPPKEEGVVYLCVADVQITDRKIGRSLGQPAGLGAAEKADGSGPKVQLMRMVGHVRQKDLDIPEASPIIQDKIVTGIAGLF
ncbi:MAG TPA: complement resistance protein TraT, partial [Nitrospira sp.]|nr:complement resistance protein TraT [Nitrospira sp.]